ncbi:MAG: hypothetical protein M1838_004270 [Thelocarpon superellum]|nr:MAG: hypothetical protein M1838_004270 [Thelocarpon superellum]
MAEGSQAGGMMKAPPGPPYAPTTAALGGTPTVALDVPITAVFLALYLLGAATHMTIFQLNKRKGHKFIISGMMFGFCMARTVTCILRIAWATRPTKVPLAIAASVFVSAGVLLLFIVNLVFAQRLLRASHPNLGWHRLTQHVGTLYIGSIVVSLIMLITCTVQSFYTLNLNTHRIDRDVQLYGATYFSVVAFLPIPITLISLLVPRRAPLDKFGVGRHRTKVAILLLAAVLLTLGASFRAGTTYLTPRPSSDPAWYQSKTCFYLFDFTIEILVIYLYAILRVDMRFWVPNGAHGPGAYSTARKEGRTSSRIFTEEEVLDDAGPSDGDEGKDTEKGPDDSDEK